MSRHEHTFELGVDDASERVCQFYAMACGLCGSGAVVKDMSDVISVEQFRSSLSRPPPSSTSPPSSDGEGQYQRSVAVGGAGTAEPASRVVGTRGVGAGVCADEEGGVTSAVREGVGESAASAQVLQGMYSPIELPDEGTGPRVTLLDDTYGACEEKEVPRAAYTVTEAVTFEELRAGQEEGVVNAVLPPSVVSSLWASLRAMQCDSDESEEEEVPVSFD
ncbi:MAG: hypothetical protein P4L40_25410 [Terracidiphilus sp.]|nr:hypothetical protein [Terracidiphilus sp.]